MTFQKDETGIRQTAANVAATLTAAELAAGIIKSHDNTVTRFGELSDSVFATLDEARVRDNEMFKAEEAAAPAPKKSYAKKSGSAPAASADISDPGSVVFKGNGKFAGLTVAEVFAMDEGESLAKGYTDKEGNGKLGSQYIEWVSGNEKNPFMQKVAIAFLDAKRAGSDA